MYNCKNCGEEISLTAKFCQGCGQKNIPDFEELVEGARALKGLKERTGAPLDTSPEGLIPTMEYIAGVSRAIKIFGDELIVLIDHQKKAGKKPKLLRKKNWRKKALSHMNILMEIAVTLPTKETLVNIPPGLFAVAIQLMKLRQSTIDFFTSYLHFLDTEKQNWLDQASANIKKIGENQIQALDEIDKVTEQIALVLKRRKSP